MARKPAARVDAPDRESPELEWDPEFQNLEWRLQRWGWAAMAVAIVAALGGLFGSGPLAVARAGDPDGPFAVRYDRFQRCGVDTRLEIDVRAAGPNEAVVVRFERGYLERFEILDVTPQPSEHAGTEAQVAHRFRFDGTTPRRIVYRLEPRSAGRARSAIAIDGAGAVNVDSFVYP